MKKDSRKYWNHNFAHLISAEELSKSDRETQKEVMRDWFLAHYEDPADHTPYESREGGYIYIWGGPYDAHEELLEEFGDIVSEDIINELAQELEAETPVWEGKPDEDYYDKYLYEVISSNTQFFNTFKENIENINELLNVSVALEAEQQYYMLLYVNIIIALETYLSDAFINTLFKKREFIRTFIEKNPDFQSQKLSLSEIFVKLDTIERDIKNYLVDILWHNLSKDMYYDTFNISFPDDLASVYRAIAKRHDIVHRNGKTKEGKIQKITKEEILSLNEKVSKFVEHIDEQLSQIHN